MNINVMLAQSCGPIGEGEMESTIKHPMLYQVEGHEESCSWVLLLDNLLSDQS